MRAPTCDRSAERLLALVLAVALVGATLAVVAAELEHDGLAVDQGVGVPGWLCWDDVGCVEAVLFYDEVSHRYDDPDAPVAGADETRPAGRSPAATPSTPDETGKGASPGGGP
ncbi:MAG: hypothetical protein Q8Q14_15495 [Gemmatimonadales bacterium]|nr:hypothetical protein [Gemmatimonadales bacterium]